MPQDHSTEAYQADLSLLHKASARRLRQLCQSNAGIYIKAAQLLSTAQAIPQEYRKCVSPKTSRGLRACCPALVLTLPSSERPLEMVFESMLPSSLLAPQACGWGQCCSISCRRLEVLQDSAEPRGFEEVQLAVVQQLGAPIQELFAEFEPEARAAASLAQVCFLCPLKNRTPPCASPMMRLS